MIYNMIDTDELVSSLVEPTLNRNVLNNLILENAYNSNNHDIKLISPVPKGFKFGIQIGSDWPQMGQICDFLRSVLVHFGSLM